MQTNFQTLSSSDTLARVTKLLLSGAQQDFPVTWGSEVIGILTRADLMTGLSQSGAETRVADVMRREFRTAQAEEMLEPILTQLATEALRTVPVLRNGQLAGLLTLDNVGEFVMIESALRSQNSQNSAGKSGV